MTPISFYFHHSLLWVILTQNLIFGYFKMLLQKGKLSEIGRYDSPESFEIFEQLWILAEIVYSVSIKSYHAIIR